MMKLTKKEAGKIRVIAFYKNVLGENVEKRLQKAISTISEKKQSLALAYYDYLTSNVGKKSYVVDFVCHGAGNLTFHDCTAEEAEAQAIEQLQNGAFGQYAKLEEITIKQVSPDVIYHNQFEDFLKSDFYIEEIA